jgi:hypothetical protein
MNYLVTHYKNLAEQLQSRINHIQQCLYEMDLPGYGGVTPPPENPGHGGGFYDRTNTINNRPTSAGPSSRDRGNQHGGGFYPRPTNEPIRRPSSAGDSERPTTYNPNHEFWARREGRTWLQNWNDLAAAMRSPNGITRSMREFLEQNGFENLAAYRQFLINQALGQGVIPPPFPL